MSRQIRIVLCLVMAACAFSTTGCFVSQGPSLGILSVPIPVSPYFQTKKEDEFWMKERYLKVPIMGPVTEGGHIALDEPSDDEVVRAWEQASPVEGNWPFLYEIQRSDVKIVREKIADYMDPPRFVPLIGPAQLHHAHYKCTIYYTETVRVGWPIPHSLVDEESVEVIYIDHNHFHRVGGDDGHTHMPSQ